MTRRSLPIWALSAALTAGAVSGAAGLIYEVCWARMLVVPLGNAADATALVLASFMLGMALGARAIGALADRLRSPLAAYATVEALLAAIAVAMPFVAPRLAEIDAGPAAIGALAALLVGLPSALMGAAVPVLVRGLSRVGGDVERRVGPVYGLNTAGGAAGAALAGFAMIPQLGLSWASFAGAAGSATASLIGAALARLARPEASAGRPRAEKRGSGIPPDRRRGALALAIAATCGLATLGCEVLWTRVLTFVFGHDTYAFATLLVVVLAGLGLGGLIQRALARRDPLRVAGAALGALALAALLSYWLSAELVVRLGRDPFELGRAAGLSTSLWLELYRELSFAPLLLLAPAICAGIAFPAACAAYARDPETAGRRVGAAVLVNGVASAAGAVLVSLALIPALGVHWTLVLLAALAALVGAIALFSVGAAPRARAIAAGSTLAVVAAAALAAPPDLPRRMLLRAVGEKHQRLLHYDEARTGTVSVTQNEINGERQLFVNAVNEVTTRLVHDQSFSLLGHLAPLLHPDPDRGLMICFGAGISAGAALSHPLERLDVVDLSAATREAARFFEQQNNGVLDDERMVFHVGDGRRYLLGSDRLYDVMMVDSTHPKAVDSWALYTVEFYRLLREHLAEDGIAVQWVPLHGLSEWEFKSIVRTFLEVFPRATLWVNAGFETYGQSAYVKMVGARAPLRIDYRELSLRVGEPRIAAELARWGMDDPIELLDCFLAGPSAVRGWVEGAPVQTDDRPFLPYITRLSSGRRMSAPLLNAVRSPVAGLLEKMGREEPEALARLALAREAEGLVLAGLLDRAIEIRPEGKKLAMYRERLAGALEYYEALAELYSGDADELFEIASYLGNLGHPEAARRLYERSLEIEPGDPRTRVNLALTELDLGERRRAEARLRALVEERPEDALASYNLGVVRLRDGDAAGAIPRLRRALELDPDLHGARLALAESLVEMQRLDRAEGVLRDVLRRAPWTAAAWDMLGLVEARRESWREARRHHTRALRLDPYRAESHYNLGIALQEQGRLQLAARAYLAALRIRPEDAEALNNLGLVYAGAGLYEQAAERHRRALEIDPRYPEAAYNLALAYQALGRVDAAVEMLAVAIELAPELEPARRRLEELGIEDARVEVAGPDAGAPRGDAGPDGGSID